MNEFGPSSVDFFIYAHTRTTNWEIFHRVKENILLDIAAIIAKHGAEIAFPTTTIQLPKTDIGIQKGAIFKEARV